jgi:putative endonuclease
MQQKTYWVYILTNHNRKLLYTGVTNNLPRRIEEHKQHSIAGFTKKYNIDVLVFAETFQSINEALLAEKKIKAGSRQKKILLIESLNPEWRELTF